jgi:aldehyde dehydrogenase (NAD+)
MMKIDNFIKGELIKPAGGKYFKNINPADRDDLISLFADSGKPDVERAVFAAKDAYRSWSELPPPKRGELIYRVADLLKNNQKTLAEMIVREMGKSLPEAMGDMQSSIDAALFMAGEGRRLYGQTTFSALQKRWAVTKRMPIGVCGLITAWNAPMAIITWKLFPALICGNTVVLKPSENTPMTAHLLGKILKEAGIPDGVVNIIYGKGPATGEALVRHPDVKAISFTGSTKVGKIISEECGRQLKRCSLEMGGKNGLIVMEDADIDAASKAVAAGAFSTAGQRCASTSRVFVHKNIYSDFIKKLIEETKKMKAGICPIINREQYDSILKYIKEAKRSGAKCIYGGKPLSAGYFSKGDFMEPAIFVNVKIDSKIAQEEIFGPVLSVFKIENFNEALKMINNVAYGLTASIFTSNINLAMLALDGIEAGCCYVNAPTFGSEPHMPFGGIKNSGNGTREPGTQALDVFSEWKTVYIDYSGVTQNSQYKT